MAMTEHINATHFFEMEKLSDGNIKIDIYLRSSHRGIGIYSFVVCPDKARWIGNPYGND